MGKIKIVEGTKCLMKKGLIELKKEGVSMKEVTLKDYLSEIKDTMGRILILSRCGRLQTSLSS